MSPAGRSLEALLARAVRRVRAEAATAVALGAVVVVPVVLLGAWLVGGAWPDRGGAPLVVGVAALLAGVGIAGALARRWLVPVGPGRVAAEAERRRGLPEGSLRAVLELGRDLPAGVSAALFRRSEAELARGLADATPRELSGELGAGVRRIRFRLLATTAVLAGLAAMAGFVAPERARAGWAPLLHPVAHLTGPALPPLAVRPGHADVPRGDSVAVEVDAPGRSRVAVHWREVGDVPRSRSLETGDGSARAMLGPVDAEVRYWITAPDGAATDTFTLRPVDPLLLRTLVVELEYPAYVGRSPDRLVGEIPPLEVPEGTRLRLHGSATRPLAAVALARSDGATRALAVEEDRFRGDWRLGREASGVWSWRARGGGGEVALEVAPLDIRVVADSAPRVRITTPDPEAVMAPSLRQAVLADAEDDHGLRSASLVFRRVSGTGTGPESRVTIPMEAAARVLLRGVLDASGEPLVAGDAVEYRVEVTDNSPRGQVGRSATHVLRLAGAGELRNRARSEVAAAQEAAERLAERSRRLQQETRDLSRQAARRSGAGTSGSRAGRSPAEERLGFEAAREAEDVLREHESVLQEAASLGERLEALERSIEAAGLRDPELQRRLTELRELFERLATPEVRRELAAMREAVDALDPEAVREALAELAARQEELRERLEQSLELMRRAAAEQELTALAREAEEIAAEQRALADALAEEAGERPAGEREGGEREAAAAADGEAQTGEDEARPARPDSAAADPAATKSGGSTGADSTAADAQRDAAGRQLSIPRPSLPIPRPRLPKGDRAEQQDSLRERAERLNASLNALRPQLLQIGEKETASEAGAAQESGEAAQQSMQDASSQARQQQGAEAAASGRQAAGEMSDAASRLDAARRQMTEAWKREAQQAVRQATQEALDLAQREESLRQAMEQAQQQGSASGTTTQQLRSEQAALQQGLQQLGRNLSETGRRSGLVSPEVGRALARSMLDMQRTMDGMQEAGGMPLQQAGQAVESLNQLAMSLLQNDAQIERSESGATEQALRQLAQLAQQQASLNAQTGAVPPLELGEQALARQLDQLAQQQRGIGRRTGEIGGMLGGREDVLGRLDQLSSEAEALARDLEGGRLDPELRARQEQLFRRLLDAGRSLEREEYSDEREGTRAGAVEVEPPAALDPALVDPRLRYAPPTPEQLRGLPPAYRRLILEYFDRLNGRGGGS